MIFDWAGTIVDYGSFAPTKVLIQAFAERGVAVSLAEARVPMGLPKWDHIQALGRLPGVAGRWRERFGRAMTREDVDALYARFMPLQLEYIAAYSGVIPGVLEVLEALRARGMRIGSCSGYPREVMDQLVRCAREQGLQPGPHRGRRRPQTRRPARPLDGPGQRHRTGGPGRGAPA